MPTKSVTMTWWASLLFINCHSHFKSTLEDDLHLGLGQHLDTLYHYHRVRTTASS